MNVSNWETETEWGIPVLRNSHLRRKMELSAGVGSSLALGFLVERHGSSLRGHGHLSRACSLVEGFLGMIGNLVIYMSYT